MTYFTFGLRCKKLTTLAALSAGVALTLLFDLQDLRPVTVLRDLRLDTVRFGLQGRNVRIECHGDVGFAACVRQSDIRRQAAERLVGTPRTGCTRCSQA